MRWGGPGAGYEWPLSNHGITVDHKGNVWIGGNGDNDTQILKFTRTGKFLLQIGKQGEHNGSNDTAQPVAGREDLRGSCSQRGLCRRRLRQPPRHRLRCGYGAVQASLGRLRREARRQRRMPAYDPKAPPSKQFNTVHCANVSQDGLVYVCDRVNDRIQVFRKDGTFVKEAFFDRETLRSGSVWDMAFSRDPQQTYLYIANGVNEKIHVVLRSTLEVLTSFGDGGRQPGQFFGVHNLDTDSKGNLYTAETYTGARVQRFVYKGLRPSDEARIRVCPGPGLSGADRDSTDC